MYGNVRRSNPVRLMLSFEPLSLFLLLLGLAGILAIYDEWQRNRFPVLVIVGVGAAFVTFASYTYRRAFYTPDGARRIGLPPQRPTKYFFPFLRFDDKEGKPCDPSTLDPRPEEVAEVSTALQSSEGKYIVLCGTSGVGKSALLACNIRSTVGDENFLMFSEYRKLFRDIIRRIQLHFSKHIPGGQADTAAEIVLERFERFLRKPDSVQTLTSALKEFVSIANGKWSFEHKLVIAFDQAERLVVPITALESDEKPEAKPHLIAMGTLMETLRKEPALVPLFSVRGDGLSDLLSAIASFHAPSRVRRPDKCTQVLILRGIDAKNLNALANLETKLGEIDSNIKFQHVVYSLNLGAPDRANTFETQLTGYMAEHFSSLSRELSAFFRGKNAPPNLILKKYFEFMANGYLLASSMNGPHRLSTVLFAVAAENKASGQPVTMDELSRVSHLPYEDVEACIDFVVSTGALIETRKDGTVAYRLAHDQLVDHVIGSDDLRIRRDHRDAIAALAGRGYPKDKMKAPRPKALIFNIFSPDVPINGPQLVIISAILFCLFRLFDPEPIYSLLGRFDDWLQCVIPGIIQPFEFKWEFYLPIIACQCLWVTFMYQLDRGYFRYVTEKSTFAVRALSRWSAPIGGILGGLFCFAPALFIVPVVVGGTGLAFTYLLHARSADVLGAARENSRELASKTFANMAMAVGFNIVFFELLKTFQRTGDAVSSLILIWFATFGFTWFWFMMRSRQGSQEGWSALLAIYDQGRMPTLSQESK